MKQIEKILEERNEIARKLILAGHSFAEASMTATQYVGFAYGEGVFERINKELNISDKNNESKPFNVFLYKRLEDTITLLNGTLSANSEFMNNNTREDCKIAIENLKSA